MVTNAELLSGTFNLNWGTVPKLVETVNPGGNGDSVGCPEIVNCAIPPKPLIEFMVRVVEPDRPGAAATGGTIERKTGETKLSLATKASLPAAFTGWAPSDVRVKLDE